MNWRKLANKPCTILGCPAGFVIVTIVCKLGYDSPIYGMYTAYLYRGYKIYNPFTKYHMDTLVFKQFPGFRDYVYNLQKHRGEIIH